MQSWKLQDAKARFSEVVKEATTRGPQVITLRGQPAVVVLSKEDYDKLVKPELSFVEFMRLSPLAKININIERDPSLTRDIDL
jgi:prevent-host-death family protein